MMSFRTHQIGLRVSTRCVSVQNVDSPTLISTIVDHAMLTAAVLFDMELETFLFTRLVFIVSLCYTINLFFSFAIQLLFRFQNVHIVLLLNRK